MSHLTKNPMIRFPVVRAPQVALLAQVQAIVSLDLDQDQEIKNDLVNKVYIKR
jgi:hypothetical protein